MEVDWDGSLYCGITLDWDYANYHVDISMPKYVQKQLLRFNWSKPKRNQDTPWDPVPINYGRKSDKIIHEKPSPPLGKAEKKFIQQVVGCFLYYARAIDMTILLALNDIATESANPTEKTMKRVHQLLDYMASHPDAVIRFRRSDMILNVHSDLPFSSRIAHLHGGIFLPWQPSC